jgi:hypothetical protein
MIGSRQALAVPQPDGPRPTALVLMEQECYTLTVAQEHRHRIAALSLINDQLPFTLMVYVTRSMNSSSLSSPALNAARSAALTLALICVSV